MPLTGTGPAAGAGTAAANAVAAPVPVEGATDLPTDLSGLRYDMLFTSFVQNDRMWVLGMSDLAGYSSYSMWEL